MQMQLPFFPPNTELLSSTWGVRQVEDSVYYLHNGSPVYTHHKEDINTFRFVTASLIENTSCRAVDLAEVFKVNVRNLYRYAKKLREKGPQSFFNPTDNRGKCYKMTPERIAQAQEYLDHGYSQVKTAQKIGVHEASIRYHIKKGNLKKKRKKVPRSN